MKYFVKSLCFILVCLMCVTAFASCTNDSIDTQAATTLDGCRIIFSSDSEYSDEAQFATLLKDTIQEKFGITLETNDDFIKAGEAYDSESKEILIGHTAYPQSQAAAERVTRLDYLVTFDGNKIILISGRANGLEACVEYFAENYLSIENNVLTLKSTEEHYKSYDYNQMETTATLASLNLRYAYNAEMNQQSKREPRIVSFIKDNAPDSIGFQECEAFWKTKLDSELGKLGYESAQEPIYDLSQTNEKTENTDDSNYALKNYIYYNKATTTLIDSGVIWLTPTPTVVGKGFGSRFYMSASWALLENKDTGATYIHISTHFDSESAIIRNEQAKVLVSYVKTLENKGHKVFIAGDFNDVVSSNMYTTLSASFVDAKSVTEDTIELNYTYNGYSADNKEPDSTKFNWIDYCFFKGESITVNKYDVVDKWKNGYMSDHNALLIEFTLKR